MLYIYIYFSFSHTLFDFSQRNDTIMTFVLFLNPLEKAEIKIKNEYGTILSKWSDDIYLDIYAENFNHDLETFGPFDSSSDLVAIHFQTKNYSLRFINEGQTKKKIALIISKRINESYQNYFIDDEFIFPFFENYQDIHDFNYFFDPFVYDVNEENGKDLKYLFIPLILVYYGIFLVFRFLS